MIERLHRWNFNRRRTMMEKWMADPSTGMGQMVQNRAMQLAMTMVMRWLENKRIIHCALCPATDELKKMQDRYWCKGHYDKAKESLEQKEVAGAN